MLVDQTLLGAQRGLLMRAIFGQILSIKLKTDDKRTHNDILRIVLDLNQSIDSQNLANPSSCGLVVAFSPQIWGKWTGQDFPIHTATLDAGVKFTNSRDDVLLYVKAPDHETAAKLVATVLPRLKSLSLTIDVVIGGKRPDVRIIGGRYLDGITNPNDPISLTEDILLNRSHAYPGASFALTQKFIFDWPSISSQAPDTQDQMIGRNTDGTVLPRQVMPGHIYHANVRDRNGDERKLLRQALPFGEVLGHAGREKGLMFVAFCNDQGRFEQILRHLLGRTPSTPADPLMDVVHGVMGGYWYVPAAVELGVTSVSGSDDIYEDPHWNVRSANGYLFYNSTDYLHQMASGLYKGGDPPSSRLLNLMSRTFSHWRDGWVHRNAMPRLPHLKDVIDADSKSLLTASILQRKGLANFKTLADLLSSPTSNIARFNGLLRIDSKELIVGVIPDFTLGRGKEVVPYLTRDETIAAWLKGELNEWSAMGHIVPDYEQLVKKGLAKLLEELESLLRTATAQNNLNNGSAVEFYKSAISSLQGVQGYLRNWANIALESAKATEDPADAENMKDVSTRLLRLVDQEPQDFQDAVQLIFSFHSCLHLVGELTSLGRLDQILWPFLEHDRVSMERAQDIMDCLWVKIGENAFINRTFIYDYVTYGTTAVCGLGGNFPQGGGINQWVQQITVGGYKATEDEEPVGAANPVTMLCLKSARRIPVSAPTLSLRVYKGMPEELLDEAAKAILAGGAQPILYNDDKLTEALFQSGESVTRSWSRNYAADGCYEPMLAGASEFTFNNVAPLLALEQTINQGATYSQAGPEQLRGLKQTFRSPPAIEIKNFEELQSIFLNQLEWLVIQCYNTILGAYGNLADICPSPLLSILIDGCVERGRDLTNGGARFHIIAPLCVGVSNTIDSLYAIQKLVYDPTTAITTLPDLVNCLINDWGFNMIEPFQNQLDGPADAAEHGRRYQELRESALKLPKWGSGDADLNALGDWLIENMVRLCVEAIRKPSPALEPLLSNIATTHGPDFEFVVTPGIGTFEGYVGDGAGCGASADGRRNGVPIASDLSPAPAAQDLPPNPAFRNIYQAMESYQSASVEYGLSNASPVDMNISESFPLGALQTFIKAYARGEVGGNLLTLTCADLKTYEKASKDPEQYDLVRVRMGGWTEFYATMFPAHQKQHQRRQYFTPGGKGESGDPDAVGKQEAS